MKNIIDILKGFDITIPEEKLSDFNKAFNENYKTIVEHQKVLDRVADEKKRADTAEETLKGFEGIDPKDFKKKLVDAQKAVQDAKDEAARQIAERDHNDVLRAEVDKMKFTSEAAKRDLLLYLKSKGMRLEDGKLIGFNDNVEKYKAENPDALATEGNPKPKFTEPNEGGKPGGSGLSKADILKISDRAERRAAIAQNLHLFNEK